MVYVPRFAVSCGAVIETFGTVRSNIILCDEFAEIEY